MKEAELEVKLATGRLGSLPNLGFVSVPQRIRSPPCIMKKGQKDKTAKTVENAQSSQDDIM